MGNLPQNSLYGGPSNPTASSPLKVGTTLKITPPPATGVGNAPAPLAQRLDTSTNNPALPWRSLDPTLAAKEQALQGYTYNSGVPTEQPVFPTLDAQGNVIKVGQNIPVPSDYSGFVPAGQFNGDDGSHGQWTDPTSPVIQNYPGDVQGQVVKDTANPDALIKSVRGNNPSENKFILNGRPSNLYQIDHIMPLELGGADTMANREVLSFSQNEQKTKAQAVPYTLYANGLLSLADARLMASSWKDRDVGGLPNPDGYGMVPLKQAQDASLKWTQPVQPTFKDVMSGIPQAAKDFGKGWMPDSLREFVKGFGSGATMGFLPYEAGENESTFDHIAGYGGMLAGGLGSFVVGGAILDGVLGVGAVGLRVLGALRGTAAVSAEAAGLTSAESVASQVAPKLGARIWNAVTGSTPVTEAVIKAVPDTAPSYIYKGFVSPLTKPTVQSALKFAGTNVLVGQMQQLVQNQLNPDILSGKQQATAEKYLIPRIISDAVIGGVAGVASPTLKGASLAMAPVLAMNFVEDPYHPMNALTSAAVFGAFHLAGAGAKKADINNLKQDFADAAQRPDFQTFKTEVLDKPHYNTLSYYAPELYPELKPGTSIPASAYSAPQVKAAADKALAALDIRRNFDLNPDGTKAEVGMSDQAYNGERARIITASNQMAIGGLTPELQEQANVANIISFAKSLKGKSKNIKDQNTQSRFDQLQDIWIPKSTNDVGKYIADNVTSFADPKAPPVTNAEPKYLNGDFVGTGVGIKKNTDIAKQFFSQEPGWNTLPRVSVHWRPELESVFAMGNKVKQENPALAKGRSLDPNPGNAAQIFGYKQNQQTGQIKTYSLGYVASDGRLNTDPLAINKETATWTNPPPPIAIHKDMLVPEMDKNGVHISLASIDWRSTNMTKKSGNPFGVYRVSDKDWNDSIAMRDKLAATGAPNPYTTSIAQIRHSQNASTVSKAISEVSSKINNEVVEPASPQELQSNLLKNVDLVVTPKEAIDIFALKDNPAIKEGLNTMVQAENSGNGKVAFKAKVKFMKTVKDVKLDRSKMEDYPIEPVSADAPLTSPNEALLTPNPSLLKENTPLVKANDPELTPKPQENTGALPDFIEPVTAPGDNFADQIVSAARINAPESPTPFKGTSQSVSPRGQVDPVTDAAQNYIEIGKTAIDDATPSGTGAYQLKNYTQMFDATIKRLQNQAQSDLQKQGFDQKVIDEVKARIESEVGNQKAIRISTLTIPKDEEMSGNEMEKIDKSLMPSRGAIDKPVVYSKEFFDNIDQGLSADPATPQHFAAKAWDTALTAVFGKNYKTSIDAARFLSSKSPEGAAFWNHGFFSEVNSRGREITQDRDIVDARARGDRQGELDAYTKRNKLIKDNPSSTGGTLSQEEMANLGIESEGEGAGFAGMSVKPWVQEDNMVQDLTHGEDMMAAVSSDLPMTPVGAVHDVKRIFLGAGKDNPGLLKYINDFRAKKGLKKVSLPFSIFENLAKEAKNAASADESIVPLQKQYISLQKALEHGPDPMLEQALEDIQAKMQSLHKTIGRKPVADGAGGPGFFSTIGNVLMAPFSQTLYAGDAKPQAPSVLGVSSAVPKPTSYDVRGVKVTDDDLKEAGDILYGEISNRPGDRQDFEVNNIVNTALNRSLTPGLDQGKTLTQVLQRRAQFQGYAPEGMTVKGGKVIQSQYQKAKAGQLDAAGQKKYQGIMDSLNKIKSGNYPDSTGGSTFYVHASDGTMWLGKSIKEAKDNANAHEKQIGSKTTQWGTAVGMPASSTKQ